LEQAAWRAHHQHNLRLHAGAVVLHRPRMCSQERAVMQAAALLCPGSPVPAVQHAHRPRPTAAPRRWAGSIRFQSLPLGTAAGMAAHRRCARRSPLPRLAAQNTTTQQPVVTVCRKRSLVLAAWLLKTRKGVHGMPRGAPSGSRRLPLHVYHREAAQQQGCPGPPRQMPESRPWSGGCRRPRRQAGTPPATAAAAAAQPPPQQCAQRSAAPRLAGAQRA
jgi:hypothetical protein